MVELSWLSGSSDKKGLLVTVQEWAATLRRRWYVIGFAMFLALVGIYGVHKRTISYDACNSMYVSGLSGQSFGGDRYDTYNPSVAVVTQAVTVAMMSQPEQSSMVAAGVPAGYQVAQTNSSGDPRFPTYTQPTLTICDSSDNPTALVSGINTVAAKYQAVLLQLQAAQGVPRSALLTAAVLVQPVPVPGEGRPSQAALGLALIGLIVGISLAVWTDRLLPSSGRRRRTPSAPVRPSRASFRP
jgi:hypothetical protein